MANRNFNGEGTVYYSEKLQRYVAQFTDKNHKRKTIYAKTEKEAKKKLRATLSIMENGGYVDKNKVTILEIATKIVEQKHAANLTGSAAYIRSVDTINLIKKYEIAQVPIQEVTKEDLQGFLNQLKAYSNSCISKVYQIITSAYKTAIEENLVSKMPKIIKPKSDKPDKKVEALTLEQHKIFINSLENEPYKNIMLIAINTGMRIGEILALKSNDIDLETNVIHVNKTISKNDSGAYEIKSSAKTFAGARDIPFDTELKRVLKDAISNEQKNKHRLIFSYNGDIIKPTTLNTVFKRICKNLGFEGSYNFHMLRHTFATRCIESGMPAHVLQKILGHADVSVTINTYTSIFDKYKKDEFDKYLKYKKENGL